MPASKDTALSVCVCVYARACRVCVFVCVCVSVRAALQGLETIPHLKDDIADRDKRIAQLEKDIEDKSALLTASRKAIREYKDRIRVGLSEYV